MSRVGLLLATIACSFASGCSNTPSDQPALGQVEGVVTLDGEPLAGVTVYFKPEEGRPSQGVTDLEGRYKAMYRIDLSGVKVGPNKVHLEWGIDASGPAIPPAYGTSSTLTLDVQKGRQVFNIEASTSAKGS